MDDFEKLLQVHRPALERYVRFRLSALPDAEDVLQEVFLTACQKFPQLKNHDAFKPWKLSIARNKCHDYFRARAAQQELPLDGMEESMLAAGRYGPAVSRMVQQTLNRLEMRDQQILYLYFWRELPQAEIAKRLKIPVGTVKSRLHTAKRHFRDHYPFLTTDRKEESSMKKMPARMPEYTITPSMEEPFPVKWEELMGWFLVPKPGEKLSWGMYDMPSRACLWVFDMQVTGKARVHGIDGVELTAQETSCTKPREIIHRTFVAQLTDTHCRYLATTWNDGDVKKYITFLDEDEFMPNWGFGENNCGNEVNLCVKGDIRRNGMDVVTKDKPFLLDVVGRYTVTIGEKTYDTVCVMDVDTYMGGVASEQFLDRNGRTILWRRFNRDDWAMERYHKLWSEQLPQNDRITVNGKTYVHWYDCVTDYIL